MKLKKIIRSCGRKTPHLWPTSFPAYTGELYCGGGSVFSSMASDKTLIANNLGSRLIYWTYHVEKKVFACRVVSGAFTICKLIVD